MSQFYNAVDKELSLYHHTLFLLGIPETDTTTYPVDGTFTRSANFWYRRAVNWIWRSASIWEFDDTNYATLPIATTTLVNSQEDYGLPATALDILRCEVKDASGNFQLVEPIDKSQVGIALTEFQKSDGLPRYYDIIGNSLFLYPAPATASVTLTAGLKIYLSRDIDAFTPADTTQEPGFSVQFHPIISYGSALDFAVSRDITAKITLFRNEIETLHRELEEYHAQRQADFKKRIRPKMINPI